MTLDDSKEKALDAAQTRGKHLDEAVEKVGRATEEKVAPIADKLTDKLESMTGGSPEKPNA